MNGLAIRFKYAVSEFQQDVSHEMKRLLDDFRFHIHNEATGTIVHVDRDPRKIIGPRAP